MSKQEYLNEDPKLSGQNYVCLSFLTPAKEDQTTLTGLKVRGVFDDYDEACKHAKQLQEMDPAFGIFVGEVGKWLPFDPDPDSDKVKSSEYQNEELNGIMKNYLVNQEKAKIFHEKRKNEMARKNLEENLTKVSNQFDKTKQQLRKAKGDMKETLEKRMENMTARIKEMEEKTKHLQEQEEKCLKQMEAIDNNREPARLPDPPRNVDL